MRIIVMSDSHKNYFSLQKIITANRDADYFIHLGDGEHDVELLLSLFPDIAPRFYHVTGNCDYNSLNGPVLVLPVGGHKIYACHGHNHGVNFTLENLKRIAEANGCDIVLYGHTHARLTKYEDGMYIMNPGSTSSPRNGNKPSYGFIDIVDSGVITNIVNL